MKVPSGSILHNLNPFSWTSPMKEGLQPPLLYEPVPKYGRFFSTPLQRHSVFSWYSDIHECRALPVTTQPTGIAGISPSPCPRFLQTKKSESLKVVVSSKKKVSSSHGPIQHPSQLFKQSSDRFILVKSTLWPWTPLGRGEPACARVGGR